MAESLFQKLDALALKLGADGADISDNANLADTIDSIERAVNSSESASTNALKSEGFAVGKQNGTAVESESPYYHNNAEYYAEQASESAAAAAESATALTTDDTLTQSGRAADAKKTGDEISDLNDAIAEAFDPEADYEVGDFCTHDHRFYRCVTPITGAVGSSWDASKWDDMTVGDVLKESQYAYPETKIKIELIPNVSTALSSYSGSGGTAWYLSDRVIPAGSTIKTVKIAPKENYNYGGVIFVNDDNIVVAKYVQVLTANVWNVFNINLVATENLRIVESAKAAFTTAAVTDDNAFNTDGVWQSNQSGLNVGDTMTFTKTQSVRYMLAVQWEVETTTKCHNFAVSVNCHDYTDDSSDGETLYTDYGVIALPSNYSAKGVPIKLIILCGGSGDRITADTDPLSNQSPYVGWEYYLAKGYAVMDMNGISQAWGTAMNFPMPDRHYCNKRLIESYQKGYEYVLNKFNIDKTKVFIAGISMGGGASALLVQSGIFPVVAHCMFCPALSVYKQDYMNTWGGTPQQKTIAGQYGFTDWETTTTFDQAYFLANIDKISGFDNLTIRAIGDIDTANAHYGDTQEAEAYNSMQKIYPVPVKIWHSVDDPLVLYRYSGFFVNMIKNGGGQAWLRTFPSGAHAGGWNYGSVSDTDIDGNAITTSISFYESVLFFKRFG